VGGLDQYPRIHYAIYNTTATGGALLENRSNRWRTFKTSQQLVHRALLKCRNNWWHSMKYYSKWRHTAKMQEQLEDVTLLKHRSKKL
jgi:hypothetical protein